VFLPPTITTQPVATQKITSGNSATFSVLVAGTAPLSYQWKLNGKDIEGETRAGITAVAAGKYTVEVKNAGGKTLSKAGVLEVSLPPANAITAQDAAENVQVALLAKGVKLTAKLAKGSAKPVGYQWVRVNADGTETVLTDKDATKATYTAKVSGLYKVRLLLDKSDSPAHVDGIVAQVKIIIPPDAKLLTITTDKTVTGAATGEAVTLTATLNADVSTDELSFIWYVNGKAVSTTPEPTTTVKQGTKATTFAVQVTNGIAAKKIVGKAKSKAVKVALATGN
jgi:hypothetical protein